MPDRMPTLFIGHGNPMNAMVENEYSRAWRLLGHNLPRPRAVLAISAHWYVPLLGVTAMDKPRTIHDFGGFPRELHEFQYPAPGDPQLARELEDLLRPANVRSDRSWGLDHGTWSVLAHLFPKADVPVVQLSIEETQPPQYHYDLGKKIGTLRDKGVLLLGSGNVVHNLHSFAWGVHSAEPFDWAQRFENTVREHASSGNHAALIDYEALGSDALLSAPTPDHYLPLLYVLGAHRPEDRVSFPVTGVDGGSVSMLSILLK